MKKITYPKLNDGSLLTSEYLYNALGQLTSLTNKKGTSILSKYIYSYDANGNITTVNDGQIIKSYVYDKLNRLIEIQPQNGYKTTYSYDLKGNRQIENSPRMLANINTNFSYSYDLENKLKTVTKNGSTSTMSYSADGMRAKKQTGSNYTSYIYNLSGQLVAEAKNSSAVTANYVWGPDRVISKREASGGDYYYLYNGHGDVTQLVDKNGNVVNNYLYDEWGNITTSNETISNPFKYAGEIYDQETGLYYLRARYYDPSMGRFINEDTYEGQIYNPLSLNLYTYCKNNSIKYIDPSGHIVEIAGNIGFTLAVLAALGELTSYTLMIKDNKVVITNYYDDGKHNDGNKLILQLVNCNVLNKIVFTDDYNGCLTGTYSNGNLVVYIGFDPWWRPKVYEEGKNSVCELKSIPNYIALGHELIHAYRAINGNSISIDKMGKNSYKYYDKTSVKSKPETVPREELATVGLGYCDDGDITENSLRAEHGLKPRGAYYDS